MALGVEKGGVKMVIPTAMDEEVEAINGDKVGEWVLAVNSAQ